MSTIPTIVVTPSAAADAYGAGGSRRCDRRAARGRFRRHAATCAAGAVDNLHAADAKSVEALSGGGNLTDVVTALARAELTLQTATAVRDRVVQAYQDIMKMPI